ncbi:hypothetical protein STANM309S_05002 [Streptomyces tanashiensis]
MRSSTIGFGVNVVPSAAMSQAVVQGLQGVVELLRGVRVEGQQRLARRHRVTRLGVELDARARLHRVLLAGAARAQAPGGDADVVRVEAGEDARSTGP